MWLLRLLHVCCPSLFTFVVIRSNRLKKSSPEDAVLPVQIHPEIISLISLTAQGAVYPVRPRSRVDQAPFLSLTCDISLIDNLCGKSHCVPKLALRTAITIYGLKRAGRRAACGTGWRKMHRRLRRRPQGAGTEWHRRRVGAGAADYVSHYFRCLDWSAFIWLQVLKTLCGPNVAHFNFFSWGTNMLYSLPVVPLLHWIC